MDLAERGESMSLPWQYVEDRLALWAAFYKQNHELYLGGHTTHNPYNGEPESPSHHAKWARFWAARSVQHKLDMIEEGSV